MPRLELASAISSNKQGSHITFSIFLIRYVLVLACESYCLGSLPNPDILIHLDSFPDELEDKEKVNARSTYVFSSGMFQYMVVYAPLVSYIFMILFLWLVIAYPKVETMVMHHYNIRNVQI